MSCRVDSTLIAGACVVGNRGLGVLGSVIRATTAVGDAGPGFLYNDWQAGDDNKEFRGLILTPPASGTLFANEDGSFEFTAPVDGSYSFVYRLYVDGEDLGTGSVSFTIGVVSPITSSVDGAGAVSWTGVGAVDATITTGLVAEVAGDGLITWDGLGAVTATIDAATNFVYGRVGPFTRVPTESEQSPGLLGRYTKQPNEVIDYPVDFSGWVRGRPADNIVSYSVSASPPNGLTLVRSTLIGNTATSVWAGGADGESYQITTTVSTAAGLVKSAEFQLRIWEV